MVGSDITSDLQRITLNDLPQWYPPAERLLTAPACPSAPRDSNTASRVYDAHTYGPLMRYIEAQPHPATIDEVRLYQLRTQVLQPRGRSGGDLCVGLGAALYAVDIARVDGLGYRFLRDGLRTVMPAAKTVVDLGAGYGFTLHCLRQDFPEHRFVGADLSALAIRLGEHLFADDAAVSFHAFDLCRPASYGFLAELDGPVVIVTSGTTVLLPSAAPVLNALEPYRAKIRAVLHWEPIYRAHDSTLLGLLRRRTMQQFSYNRDLLDHIRGRQGIRLISERRDLFGVNPLLPYSLVHWEFTGSSSC